MLLTQSPRSGPEPLRVIARLAGPKGVAPVLLPKLLHGDSCPWPRVDEEPADRRARGGDERRDIVEEWGIGSFPASDPPANW